MQRTASIDIQFYQKNRRVKLLMLLVCFLGILFCLLFLYILTRKHIHAKEEAIFKIAATESFKVYQSEVENLAQENGVKIEIQYLDPVSLAESFKQKKLNADAIWTDSKLFNSVYNIEKSLREDSLLFHSPVAVVFKKDLLTPYIKRGMGLQSEKFFEDLRDGKIKVLAPSFVQSPIGLAFYAGMYRLVAGNKFDISRENVKKLATQLAQGKIDIANDEEEIRRQLLLNEYDAIVTSEQMFAMSNKKLYDERKRGNRRTTYFIEAPRALSANFGFVKTDKEKRNFFRKIQSFVFSKTGQQMARDNGYRSVYSASTRNSIWAGLNSVTSSSSELKLRDNELQAIFSNYQSTTRNPSRVYVVLNLEEKVGINSAKIHNELKRRLTEISANPRGCFFLASTKKDSYKLIVAKKDRAEAVDFNDANSFGDEFRALQNLKAPNKTDLSDALTQATSDLCDDEENAERRSVVLISDSKALDNQMKQVQLLVKGCRKKVNFYLVYLGNKQDKARIVSDYSAEEILQPKAVLHITEKNIRNVFWKLKGYL